VSPTTATTVYTGSGRLLGLLVSHAQASVQNVLIQDGAATILSLNVDVTHNPTYISFGPGEPSGGKQEGIPFTTSLIVTRGNVEINLWYVGY
jgi:hypothetical protein